MTWLKVIIFSIVIAALTAFFMLCPLTKNGPLKEMGVGYECWFIFAIFIVSNCKKTTEAGLKCFVFFLISQPLIYLFQQPFSDVNLIKSYYGRWFIQTLFTLPGGMIAFQIKRREWWSGLILAVAGIAMGGIGVLGLIRSIFDGDIPYAIYGAFFVAAAIITGFVFCRDIPKRVVYLSLVIAAIIGLGIFGVWKEKGSGTYTYQVTEEGSWEKYGIASTNMSIAYEGNGSIKVTYERNSEGYIILKNEAGEMLQINVTVVNGNITTSQSPYEEAGE